MKGRSETSRIEGLLQVIAISVSILAVAVIVITSYVLRRTLAIFAVSFFLAYVISPIVNILERHNIHRALAILIITILILGIIGFSVFFITTRISEQIGNLAKDTPQMLSKLDAKMAKLSNWLMEKFPQLSENLDFETVSQLIEKFNLSEKVSPAIEAALSSVGNIISVVSMAVIIPFLALFMLIGGRAFRRRVVDMVPNRYFEPALVLMQEIDKQLGTYLRGRALETLVLSILAVIGLAALRVRFYGLMGVLTGVLNLVPYIGPVLGALPVCIIILVDPNFSLLILILAICLFFLLQFIDNMLLFPLIVGKSTDLGPITTVFVLLVSAKIFGVLGLIIAIPVAATMRVVYEVFRTELRGI